MEQIPEGGQQRAAFSIRHYRPSVDDSVRQQDPNLWHRVRMFIQNITQRYVNSDHPIGVFEVDIHDLWYLVIETAKITSANEATADRLVNQVVYARELGVISRIQNQSEEQQDTRVESAVTSTSARIWIDLPFLATDLRAAWANSAGKIPSIELENLAGFTARLTALGVCGSQLSTSALILLREALETPRHLLRSDADAATHHDEDIPISEFLPAILVWLRYSSYKLLSLCARGYIPDEDSLEHTSPGDLITDTGGAHQPGGFNMVRWEFWKRRLREISQYPDNEIVSEQGRKCVKLMESWEHITGGMSHDRNIARNAYFGNRD